MGLFGKSREEIERERRDRLEQNCKLALKEAEDREKRLSALASELAKLGWGYIHMKKFGGWDSERGKYGAELDRDALNSVISGQATREQFDRVVAHFGFFNKLPASRDFPKVAKALLTDYFPSVAENTLRDDDDESCVERLYEFQYPISLIIKHKKIQDVAADFSSYMWNPDQFYEKSGWLLYCLPHMTAIPDANKKIILGAILAAVRVKSEAFPLALVICSEQGWLGELEEVLRKEDRFIDVVKLLLYRKKHEQLLDWLRSHNRFFECVFVYEEMGRFKDAAELLDKLGQGSCGGYFNSKGQNIINVPAGMTIDQYQSDHFKILLGRLRGLAAAVESPRQKDKPKETLLEELDEMYETGRISKLEYEDGKAKLTLPSAKTCASCGKPVNLEHAYCPHCGSKIPK